MRRVLLYGFGYSATAVAAAADAVREAGDEPVAWMLHNNRVAAFGPPLVERATPVVPEIPAAGEVERLGLDAARPELDGQAAEDLRYLADREGRFPHEWARTLFLDRVDAHVHRALVDADPDLVVFSDVPHSVASYLLYRWARTLGLPTALLRYGPTPYHVSYVDRIDAELAGFVGAAATGGPAGEASTRHLAKLTGTYDEAMPSYIRERTGRVAQLRRAARRVGALAPGRTLRSARGTAERNRLRRRYEQRAVPAAELAQLDGPVVAVFLHLQPERTTVPEGGAFAQQWRMVQAIERQVPDGWTVLVREHPSTFRIGARLVRDTDFYDALDALPKVALVPLGVTPFALVDRADWVATVTGTVGFEAVARGGRALLFGNAAASGCPGTVRADRVGVDRSLFAAPAPTGDLDAVTGFLASLDSSPRCWVAPWEPTGDIRGMRASGAPYPPLLRALLADPAIVGGGSST